jgi:hypothetical protein
MKAPHRMMRLAEHEVSQWREIRRVENCMTEVREWFAFCRGTEFAGNALPITIREETKEQLLLLLTAEHVRLTR